jgi:hypothetical protein
VCLSYCLRPGWWTVAEAERALNKGLGGRMMLEMSPERTFGVLSPAFTGCEGFLALDEFSTRGCTFLTNNLCDLYNTGLQPLECRFCHHDRPGQGKKCHLDIEKDWHTPAGQALVEKWAQQTGFRRKLNLLDNLK